MIASALKTGWGDSAMFMLANVVQNATSVLAQHHMTANSAHLMPITTMDLVSVTRIMQETTASHTQEYAIASVREDAMDRWRRIVWSVI